MGKHCEDEFERELDYQHWLYYRESSHEEREEKHKPAHSNETPDCSKSDAAPEPVEWPAVNVFRDYPDHHAMIVEAERKYLESKKISSQKD